MAKRSDFAQKLLDDLRLRKEKLGYVTSSGQQSAQPSSTGYHGNPRRSTRETKAMKNYNGKNMVNTAVTEIWFSTKHNKTATTGFQSKEIVPVGRGTNVQNSVDVSMALALALSTSGKLHYIAKFGSEHNPHTGSIYYGEAHSQHLLNSMKHYAGQYPFLSNLQISEISKGVQKLNTILQTSSDRSNFGRDSIRIGRELLKGAMDLEESLKMLVTLQEASDYMVGSQGRKVRLLKGKEEDESSSKKVSQNTPHYKTRISFDDSTTNHHLYKLAKANDDTAIQGQRKLSPSNTRKGITKTKYDESSLNAKVTTHRRSLSCGPDSMPNSLYSDTTHNRHHVEAQNFSTSKSKSSSSNNTKKPDTKGPSSGNVRTPSIVAKLMGLEELPTTKGEVKKVEGQKDPKSKKDKALSQALNADANVGKEVISHPRHLTQRYKEKKILNEKHIKEIEGRSSKEKTNNIQSMSPLPNHAPKSHGEKNTMVEATGNSKEQFHMNHSLKEETAKRNFVQSREKAEKREQSYRRATNVPQDTTPNHESDMLRTTSNSYRSHDEATGKDNPLSNQKDDEQGQLHLASNQKNTQMSKQKSTAPMIKPKYAVREIARENEHVVNSKEKFTVATKSNHKSGKSDKISTQKKLSDESVSAGDVSREKNENIEQPREYPKSNYTEMQKVMSRISNHMELGRTISFQNSDDMNPLQTYPTTAKGKTVPQTLVTPLMKPVQVPTAKKIDTANMKVHRSENHKVLGDNSGHIKTPSKKTQLSFLNDLEKGWKERTNKDKGPTISLYETNSKQNLDQETNSTLPSNDYLIDSGRDKEVQQEMAVEETSGDYKHKTNFEASKKQEVHTFFSQGDDMNKTTFEASKKQEVPLYVDSELRSSNLEEKQKEGAIGKKNINQVISEANGECSLTDDECLLKQLLISNQHFLNTAHALFKFKIPTSVLQTSTQTCPKEENKLLLDCGYELLRRKGKREVTYAMTRPHEPGKFRYLNSLVKELNDDIGCIKLPNRSTPNNDTAEFLQMMIERDIENRKPDINCMWDIGWSSIIFASVEKDEIVRDLEKHVLNGLISEVASEFVNATTMIS